MNEPSDPSPGPEDAAQLSLFGASEDGLRAPAQRFVADTEMIRRRLGALLAKARTANAMPWPERDARMWRTVFPQMASWLPDEEANQLRFEFAREIERLLAAA